MLEGKTLQWATKFGPVADPAQQLYCLQAGITLLQLLEKMASEDEKEPATPNLEPPQMNWKEKIETEYKKIREHAETYPYVWASYIVVYGGLAMWTGYRWRKLRKTEDRVRTLQERLRKIVEAEESAAAASSSSSSTPKTP